MTSSGNNNITRTDPMGDALQKSKHYFRDIIECAGDSIYILDLANNRILDCNRQASIDLGYSRDEILNLSSGDIETKLSAREIEVIHAQLDLGAASTIEGLHRRKDGTVFPVEIRLKRLNPPESHVAVAIVRDITKRKLAETALNERQEQFAALNTNLADGMVYQINSGPNGQLRQFTYISQAVERLHGLTVESVQNNPMLLYGQVISEDLAHVTEEEARSFAARKKFEIDVRLRLPTGEIRWRRFISSPRTASNGDLLWDGIELDITEWKLVQETLLDRSQRVAQLGSWEHDLVNNILKCSSEAYRIFGIERQEFANTYEAFMEYVHPDDRAAVNAAYFGSMKLEGEPYDHEYRIVRPDGEIRVIHGKADHMRDSSGRIIRSVGIVHDITDRKRREKALHESEAHLKRAQEIAHLGSWELNLVTNEITWSDEVYRIFGLQPQEFGATYEAFLETVHSDDRAAVDTAYSRSVREGKDTYEIVHRIIRKSDGEVRVIHAKWDHFRDSSGKIVRSVGIVHDITDRKNAEKKLEDAFNEIKQLKEKLEAENIYLAKEVRNVLGFEEIVGQSAALKHVLYRVSQVAPTDMTVLIQGETGTGKGLLAYAIHRQSNRKEGPMIHVNCAALPSNLIESELFGREKGAYTGAESRQIGRFELADGGTIYLDEIGELPLELQAKLLRVIEEGKFERLGSPHTVTVDVRIIASTNRDLKEDIRQRRFREDLYYRLNVFPIEVPPLRDREGDISLLVRYFVDKFSAKYGREIKKVFQSTLDTLQTYSWPGNVRELSSFIERAVIMSHKSALKLIDASFAPVNIIAKEGTSKNLLEVEKQHIMRVLEEKGWRVEGPEGAAKVLGMNPSTLRTRMRKLAIKRPKGR
jgi:PAS domain S-box-containing protein